MHCFGRDGEEIDSHYYIKASEVEHLLMKINCEIEDMKEKHNKQVRKLIRRNQIQANTIAGIMMEMDELREEKNDRTGTI